MSDLVKAELARLRQGIAVDELQHGATGPLPLDPEQARFELTEEERVLRAAKPRTRRWKALGRFDDRLDALARRRSDALAKLQEAETRLQQAPQADARSLADWLAGGKKGPRPKPTIYELQCERDAARILLDAIAVETDKALAARLEFVEKHRERLLADAREDVDEALLDSLPIDGGVSGDARTVVEATGEFITVYAKQEGADLHLAEFNVDLLDQVRIGMEKRQNPRPSPPMG